MAIAYQNGINNVELGDAGITISIEEKDDGIFMHFDRNEEIPELKGKTVNSFSFSEAFMPGVIFDHPDGALSFLS